MILTFLIDLLGEVFHIADPPPATGPAWSSGHRVLWWRRVLGIVLFSLLAALPFLVMGWIGG